MSWVSSAATGATDWSAAARSSLARHADIDTLVPAYRRTASGDAAWCCLRTRHRRLPGRRLRRRRSGRRPDRCATATDGRHRWRPPEDEEIDVRRQVGRVDSFAIGRRRSCGGRRARRGSCRRRRGPRWPPRARKTRATAAGWSSIRTSRIVRPRPWRSSSACSDARQGSASSIRAGAGSDSHTGMRRAAKASSCRSSAASGSAAERLDCTATGNGRRAGAIEHRQRRAGAIVLDGERGDGGGAGRRRCGAASARPPRPAKQREDDERRPGDADDASRR